MNQAGKQSQEFAVLRPKTCSYLTDGSDVNKKAEGTKNCAIKRKLKFEDFKQCLEATHLENKINHIETK